MAEFCKECWKKINGIDNGKVGYRLSKELDLCEGCGEYKRVVVELRRNTFLCRLFKN